MGRLIESEFDDPLSGCIRTHPAHQFIIDIQDCETFCFKLPDQFDLGIGQQIFITKPGQPGFTNISDHRHLRLR